MQRIVNIKEPTVYFSVLFRTFAVIHSNWNNRHNHSYIVNFKIFQYHQNDTHTDEKQCSDFCAVSEKEKYQYPSRNYKRPVAQVGKHKTNS